MIWIGILRIMIVALLIIYYACVVGHATGAYYMTNRRITFLRCICPFYYWINGGSAMDAVGLNMMMDIVKKMNNK